jgi:lipoprotein-releasing system ATP-binding protein
MSETVLQAQGLSRRFTEGGLDVQVLTGTSVQIARGESLAIVGASGSGKSTLLHLLGGLDAPSAGQVQLLGRNWAQMNANEQSTWRNLHLGFVYQFHHLLPELSAEENVALPLRIRRVPADEALARARATLASVGLADRTHHRPGELSGGERQRTAIARAIVTQPSCLLADEPTGNLDRATANDVFDLLMGMTQGRGMALVVVTHDETLAARCGRMMRLGVAA